MQLRPPSQSGRSSLDFSSGLPIMGTYSNTKVDSRDKPCKLIYSLRGTRRRMPPIIKSNGIGFSSSKASLTNFDNSDLEKRVGTAIADVPI